MMTEQKFVPPLDLEKLNPKMNVTCITSADQLGLLSDFFQRKKEIGYDLETNVVKDLNNRYIRTIQVGDRDEQYVIDLMAFAHCATKTISMDAVDLCKKAQRDPRLRSLVFGPIITILKPILDSNNWLKVGHNLGFEYENMRLCMGIRMWHLWDTMWAEKVILCGLVPAKAEGHYAMDDVVRKYGHVQIDKSLQKSFDDFSVPLTEKQIIYAALDVRFPFPVKAHQTRAMERDGLIRTAQVEFDAIPAFGDMRVHGFYLDETSWIEKFNSNVKLLSQTIDELDKLFIPIVGLASEPKHDLKALEAVWSGHPKKTVEEKAGRAAAYKTFIKARGEVSKFRKMAEKFQGQAAINYASNDMLTAALLQMPGINKQKLPNTNDKTLDKLATRGVEGEPGYKKGLRVIDLVRDFRELQKAVSNYGAEFFKRYVSDITGRIHSSINQIGASTGRTSSDNPNIQNIPKDKAYRHCFKARKGYKIITTDVAGCELRIITSMSGEPVWIEAFNKNWDVHSLGAEFVYPEEWMAAAGPDCKFYVEGKKLKCKCEKHENIRNPIKNLNFGVIYGLTVFGYKRDTGKTTEDAEKDLARYRRWVPTLWAYLEHLSDEARMKLESRTTLGRRRIFKKPDWARATQHWLNEPRNKSKKREPTVQEVKQEMKRMWASVEREGRNAPVQGGNGDLMKMAIGCGFDSNGVPFLWHTLEPELGGLLENMVHDEIVVEGPEENAEKIKAAKQDAILRAGREIYKSVDMESDSTVADYWSK